MIRNLVVLPANASLGEAVDALMRHRLLAIPVVDDQRNLIADSDNSSLDRLFDRVMRYGSEGKQDSARIFAPMAIQAYEMIGTLDTHRRYDIGMIAVIAGDAAIAKAQADTILASNPTHLLGLVVAMKAAGLANKPADRAGFEKRLAAAKDAELAKKLPEYEAHRPDIEAALKTGGKK